MTIDIAAIRSHAAHSADPHHEQDVNDLIAELKHLRRGRLAAALRANYTGAELLDLHAHAVNQIDGEDTPREDPIGRLADALWAAMAMEPAGVTR